MKMLRIVVPGFLSLLAVAASPAHAQHEFEVTPFGGARFGGVVDLNTPSVDYLPIRSGWNYGVIADYTLWPRVQAEFQFNHQPTSLDQHVIQDDSTERLTSADIDMYQFGFNFGLKSPDARLQPFIVGGMGFTNFKAGDYLPFATRFSYNLGVGAKYFLTHHFGIRAEARWSPSRTTSRSEIFFDPLFGPEVVTASNYAEQGQANLGIIFRFR